MKGDRPGAGDREPAAEAVGDFLPPEYQQLPAGLARVDALLDDPVFFAPYAAHFPALSGGRRSRSGPACG
jgi:hypothetical protein